MSDFIISEEDFKFKILDKVPVPGNNQAILLYRTEYGENGSMVIDSRWKPQTAEIRHGRFDKKITFSLESKEINCNQKVMMRNKDFYFDISIRISYSLADIKAYYFGAKAEDAYEIRRGVRGLLSECGEKWDIKEEPMAEIYIEQKLDMLFNNFKSLMFRLENVTVKPDADAESIVNSDRKKHVNIHVGQNQTEEKIAENKQKELIFESDYILQNKKLERMAAMMNTFGALGPIVEEYLRGNIGGDALYEYINKNKINELNMLDTALKNDTITQEDAFRKVERILSDNRFVQNENEKALSDKEAVKEVAKETAKEEYALSDGDYL